MKIFDAHMHYSNITAFHEAARESGVDYSYEGYQKECMASNIVGSVCMGVNESAAGLFPDSAVPTPMTADLCKQPPNMYLCLGINPHQLDLAALERKITEDSKVVGMKIYAGYYHYFIHDEIYSPVYKLAAKHNLTVAIHTGDTYSEKGLLEYSHPLAADRLAYNFRDVNFILCHMGDPWIMDACEVAYKNKNVSIDISGLLAGNANLITETERRAPVMQHYKQGITYLNNYKKVLFGTDWPLVPITPYINFCKKIIPKPALKDVFLNNAQIKFPKIQIRSKD